MGKALVPVNIIVVMAQPTEIFRAYYISFGSYEQDGNTSNGKEPIEWEILEKSDKGMLIISKYVLNCAPYNEGFAATTWETSTLRSWLNNDFYNSAFSDAEKAKIITSTIVTESNMNQGTNGGNNTNDKVFCLSVSEVRKYYTFNKWYTQDNPPGFGEPLAADEHGNLVYNYGLSEQLIISPTKYAIRQGVESRKVDQATCNQSGYSNNSIGKVGATWWLRSPGYNSEQACMVCEWGAAGWTDCATVGYPLGVRPVICISE